MVGVFFPLGDGVEGYTASITMGSSVVLSGVYPIAVPQVAVEDTPLAFILTAVATFRLEIELRVTLIQTTGKAFLASG